MDFHRGFDLGVVGVFDIGIAAADMRRDKGVLVLKSVQQILRRMTIGFRVGGVLDQGAA